MEQDRTSEIQELLRQGLSRREIARRLGISSSRVQQLIGPVRPEVRLRVTKRGVTLRSADATPEQLALRVRRALKLAKMDVVED